MKINVTDRTDRDRPSREMDVESVERINDFDGGVVVFHWDGTREFYSDDWAVWDMENGSYAA